MHTMNKVGIVLGVVAVAVIPVYAGTRDLGFTYQGQLKQAGVPLTGVVDIRVTLLDLPERGAPIGPTLIFDGQPNNLPPVEIVNGLFSMSLDFGADAFDGRPRYLEIELRSPHDPGNQARYTMLGPRQLVTAAPMALHARGLTVDQGGGLQISGDFHTTGKINASAYTSNSPLIFEVNPGNVECARFDDTNCFFGLGTTSPQAKLHVAGTTGVDGIMFPDGTLQTTAAMGGGGGGFWAANGTAISNTNTGFVGINRSAPLTLFGGAEYFGIQAPATGTDFGGMYIRTDSATARPFYGYRAGNSGFVETASHYLDGGTGKWHLNNDGIHVTVTQTGYVGIGTTEPQNARLHVALTGGSGGDGWAAGKFIHEDGVDYGFGVYASTDSPGGAAVFGAARSPESWGGRFAGDVCGIFGCSGNALQVFGIANVLGTIEVNTLTPTASVHVVNNYDAGLNNGGAIIIEDPAGPNLALDTNEIMARNGTDASTLYLNNQGGDVRIGQNGGSTRVFMPVLVVTGADLAEKFPVSESPSDIEPGTVMQIDPTNPGKLRVARGAYSRMVAGVVSGAGGLSAGTILGNLPGHEDAPAIALSGRVWVRCDASGGSISPGDLLTASDSPGQAMKVVDFDKAQGAIIGKAMTSLNEGTGLVLVLVSLQ